MYLSTKPSVTPFLAFVLAVGQQALAVNDWSVPCIQGRCSWDLPADAGASGTVQIWGPPFAISDITIAAGWQITSCDASSTTQVIHIVCKDANPNCDHLFQGGVINTIVRLPDNCGPMPFARVAEHRILSPNSSSLNGRTDEVAVHALALDTDFTAATSSQNGNVQFALQGINVNAPLNMRLPARRGHSSVRSPHSSRDELHRRDFLTDALNATTFNRTAENSKQVDYSGNANLFNTTINCPVTSHLSSIASVSVDVSTDVHATISIGAVAAGTLIPPNISEFALHIALDSNIDVHFNITADILGQISSGDIPLFQMGIPGLTFPGILEIGPEFKVISNIDATFEIANIDAFVDLSFDLSGVRFVFPPQASSRMGTFTPGPSRANISASPSLGSTFSAAAHLIPQFDIELTALGGSVASTIVFLELDASVDFAVTTGAQLCENVSTELNVEVGAESSFLHLFDASVGLSLFDKSFPIWQVRIAMSL
ncbi:hypothetical protein F5148DRAFT_982388 [Russula earlei]|uniref:Uncharacterized protein n=1 Tax=Russula earlei TaxID=71964 RepID=A0ACC0U5E7_9AGAM|nr:hypothetical protein F5148DRAFT_982388 [Russula earlei]